MKLRIWNIYWILLLLFFAVMMPLSGQLQFAGKALGINNGLKATEVMYVLPPPDPMRIEAAKEMNRRTNSKPLRFALIRPLSLSPESNGSWSMEGDLRVWRVHVLSPGAFSMGLVFGSYELNPGVKLFVYDPEQKRVMGAFTSENNKDSGILPIGHIAGEELLIEMQVPLGLTDYGELELQSLSHAFLNTGFKSTRASCPAGEFGCSQACEIDINCEEGDGWERVQPSVVRIYINKGSYGEYCTGVLVNNTAYDGTPYVLTAEHCINRQVYAQQTVFQFNYESAACFGEDGPLNMSISGADLLINGDSIDFSLVELSIEPPASFGAYYSGWERSNFQTTSTATIHHPFGDVKKISFDEQIPSIPQQQSDVPYGGLDDYHYYSYWWIKRWEVGSTEGGSSGCPLFNQSRRVIGTLSGGNASCGDSIGYDAETDRVIYNPAPNYDDYYTQFGKSWDHEEAKGNALKTWLDPLGENPQTLSGFNPTSVDPKEVQQGMRYQIYPNPAKDIFYIRSGEGQLDDAEFTIVNLSGAVLIKGKVEGGSAEIHTRALAPGLYLVIVETRSYREHHKLMLVKP